MATDSKTQDKSSASIRQISDEKASEREAWFKTVVKVISWKDGIREGGNLKVNDKITTKEWNDYCKEITKINVNSKEKTIKKLEDLKEMIQKHGGFI